MAVRLVSGRVCLVKVDVSMTVGACLCYVIGASPGASFIGYGVVLIVVSVLRLCFFLKKNCVLSQLVQLCLLLQLYLPL